MHCSLGSIHADACSVEMIIKLSMQKPGFLHRTPSGVWTEMKERKPSLTATNPKTPEAIANKFCASDTKLPKSQKIPKIIEYWVP
jgi:hypothetical protein